MSTERLESALKNAHAAGDTQAAKILANELKSIRSTGTTVVAPAQEVEKPERSLGNKFINTANELIQGATLGGSDEVTALVAAGIAATKDGADFLDAYNGILGNIQDNQNEFREENPKTALAGQIVGGLATGGAGVVKTIGSQAGKKVGAKTAGFITGATEGGIAGAGFADQGESKLKAAAAGAAVGGVTAGIGTAVAQRFTKSSESKNRAAEILSRRAAGDKSAIGDASSAGFKLNEKGKVVSDKIQKAAQKQGFDDGTVSLAAGASKADKRKMLQMLNIVQKSKGNKRFAALNRTDDVIGNSIKQRVDMIRKANRVAGSRINKASEGLAGKQADFSGAVDNFISDLDDIGVKIVNKEGRIFPDFKNSDIEFNGASRAAIANIVKRMSSVSADAQQGHKVKKLIDDVVTFGKTAEGLAGKGEAVLKSLRRNIDQTLDDSFPEYKAANDLYAKTITALDNIQSSAGSKIDITGENADKALGALSRGLLSNNRGRQELINTLDELDTLSKELASSDLAIKFPGTFKQLDDDLINQAVFAEELSQRFGTQAKTSFSGEAEKAVKAGIRAASGDAVGATVDVAKSAGKKLKASNDEDAFKAMRDLLISQ